MSDLFLEKSPLGTHSDFQADTYDPSLLYPIPRKVQRYHLGLGDQLPFQGFDLWNGYELSWLNEKGKPEVAIGRFVIPCSSTNLIESKSFKLYLNSLNNSRFTSRFEVQALIQKDLGDSLEAEIEVELLSVEEAVVGIIQPSQGRCLDLLDLEIDCYLPNPDYLQVSGQQVNETLYSHLLRSNCPVTGQPDWATIEISYQGKQIDHEGLLRYIISYRKNQEFHEQCVERMFTDIQSHCHPEKLSLFARYTRRGGLDINPYRTTDDEIPHMNRCSRQ